MCGGFVWECIDMYTVHGNVFYTVIPTFQKKIKKIKKN